jgi:hypothetical protein
MTIKPKKRIALIKIGKRPKNSRNEVAKSANRKNNVNNKLPLIN